MNASPLEMTIDQLAATVGMTVRNVRAYASRGLIPAPRLVGRTGYYGDEHAARLRLIRDLVARGYTLTAVERALAENPRLPGSHALDLLNLLANPLGQSQETENMSVEALVRLAGVEREEGFLHQLEELGLLEFIDAENVRLLRPVLVKAGAQALALGLSRDSILTLFAEVTRSMNSLAASFVDVFREEVWRPFVDAGMPDSEWPRVIKRIEAILPVASQAVVAGFHDEFTTVIEAALGEELSTFSGEDIGRLFGNG